MSEDATISVLQHFIQEKCYFCYVTLGIHLDLAVSLVMSDTIFESGKVPTSGSHDETLQPLQAKVGVTAGPEWNGKRKLTT